MRGLWFQRSDESPLTMLPEIQPTVHLVVEPLGPEPPSYRESHRDRNRPCTPGRLQLESFCESYEQEQTVRSLEETLDLAQLPFLPRIRDSTRSRDSCW